MQPCYNANSLITRWRLGSQNFIQPPHYPTRRTSEIWLRYSFASFWFHFKLTFNGELNSFKRIPKNGIKNTFKASFWTAGFTNFIDNSCNLKHVTDACLYAYAHKLIKQYTAVNYIPNYPNYHVWSKWK